MFAPAFSNTANAAAVNIADDFMNLRRVMLIMQGPLSEAEAHLHIFAMR
jgi:hypothetical protein